MRVSTNEHDSGYQKYQEVLTTHASGVRSRIKVLLDDVELKNVQTADEELGEVLVTRLDDQGKLVVDGDRLATEWRYGKVEVRVEGWER